MVGTPSATVGPSGSPSSTCYEISQRVCPESDKEWYEIICGCQDENCDTGDGICNNLQAGTSLNYDCRGTCTPTKKGHYTVGPSGSPSSTCSQISQDVCGPASSWNETMCGCENGSMGECEKGFCNELQEGDVIPYSCNGDCSGLNTCPDNKPFASTNDVSHCCMDELGVGCGIVGWDTPPAWKCAGACQTNSKAWCPIEYPHYVVNQIGNKMSCSNDGKYHDGNQYQCEWALEHTDRNYVCVSHPDA
jgi:hypothetical protein